VIGIEEAYCNTAISAVLHANHSLLESRIEEVLQDINVWGKGDTLGLDAKPEITIAERIKRFDQYAILLTEERGEDANPLARGSAGYSGGPRTFFICDPTDRSAQLKHFLELAREQPSKPIKVGDVVNAEGARKQWEDLFGAPASITGACSAITCVRRGLPICSVILNYITQELFVACSAGVYQISLPNYQDISAWRKIDVHFSGKKIIHFRQIAPERSRKFVTFLGKRGYSENLSESRLIAPEDVKRDLVYNLPGGPSRILYLTELQPESESIGFILANGEKISEWIHWFAFARYGSLLEDSGETPVRFYEIFQDRPWTRDGILMSTTPAYSIFRVRDSLQGRMAIDVAHLETYSNPSKYRSTLLAIAADNDWIINIVQQYGHRVVEFLAE